MHISGCSSVMMSGSIFSSNPKLHNINFSQYLAHTNVLSLSNLTSGHTVLHLFTKANLIVIIKGVGHQLLEKSEEFCKKCGSTIKAYTCLN